jgi:hypothetical protein
MTFMREDTGARREEGLSFSRPVGLPHVRVPPNGIYRFHQEM